MNNIDRYMSRQNERLMSCSQRMLDELGYILDDMESVAAQHPEREDIRACINEVKAKTKQAATESWVAANHWSEHFDGLGGNDEKKEEKEEENEPTVEEEDNGNEEE